MDALQEPDLTQAFPESLSSSVRTVLEVMPGAPSTHLRSPDDIGLVTLNRRRLLIPFRIYCPEPDWTGVRSLGLVEQSIAGCIYTRHHDGHVRERALKQIHVLDEEWVAPFVIQLLGEYVIEIVEQVAASIVRRTEPAYSVFLGENADFLNLTAQRATSYWDVYYRDRIPKREDYPAFPALATLLSWRSPGSTC